MESKKKTIVQAVICMVLVCVIWGGYFIVKTYHADRILDVIEDDFSWVYQVDSIRTEAKEVVLQGFAFQLNKNAEAGAFEIVLEDIETGKRYFPEMQYTERTDVNDYFLCEYDYLQSGFGAIISEKKLNLDEQNYEILLRISGEKTTYRTGTYLIEGELDFVNPDEFIALDGMGGELETIVKEGVIRAYNLDAGVYIYQYEGELYWILTSEYNFDNGDSLIEYQLTTTQINKLPEERLNNEWYWDNRRFSFSGSEVSELSVNGYRVAKKELPKEYSIEKIWTGKQKVDWEWVQFFRPYYEFD